MCGLKVTIAAPQGAQWERIHLPSRRCRFNPWVGKIHWRRKWQPTPVFLPGKPHGQRSLVGYSPSGHKRVEHLTPCSVSLVWLFATPWTTAHQDSLPHFPVFSNSRPLSQLSNYLILCHPLLLLSIFPSMRVFPVSRLFISGDQSAELQLQHQSFQWIFTVDFF